MEIRTIFDRVNRYNAMPAPEFVDYYNDAVSALIARYDEKYVLVPGAIYKNAVVITESSVVRDEYMPAIISRILYLAGVSADRLAMSVQEAEDAFKAVWRKRAYGARINIRKTNEPACVEVVRDV